MVLALAWSKSTIAAVGRSLLVFDCILHHGCVDSDLDI